MAQKEEDCPLGKGGLPNALHRLEGGKPPQEGEEEAEVAREGHTAEYYKVRTLEPWSLRSIDL